MNVPVFKHIMNVNGAFNRRLRMCRRRGGVEPQRRTTDRHKDVHMQKTESITFMERMSRKPHLAVFAMLMLLVLSLVSIRFFTTYRDYLHGLAEEEIGVYLSEISDQTSLNLINQLKKNEVIVAEIGQTIVSGRYDSPGDALRFIEERAHTFGFDFIGLLDFDAVWHTPSGRKLFPELQACVFQTIEQSGAAETHIHTMFNQPFAIVTLCLEPFTIGDVTYGGIGAMVAMDEVDQALSLKYFNGQGRASILSSEGETLYPVLTGTGEPFKFFDSMQGIISDEAIERVRNDMTHGQSGLFTFEHRGADSLIHYAPVGMQDWYLFITIPSGVLETRHAEITGIVLQSAIVVSLLWAIASVCMLYALLRRQRRKAREDALLDESRRIQEDLYRMALAHSDRKAVRVNLIDRTMKWEDSSALAASDETLWVNFPDSLLNAGWIDGESAESAKRMAEEMLAGVESGEQTLLIRTSQGLYAPHRIKYTTLYNEKHEPAFAIITYEDISEMRDRELALQRWRALLDEFPAEKYRFLEQNLTRDTVDHTEGALFDAVAVRHIGAYNQRMKTFVKTYVHPEDAALFTSVMDREALLKSYYEGRRGMKIEFRLLEKNKEPRWVRLTVQMVEYPETGEIKSYKLFEDVDEAKQRELALIHGSEKDSLTGVFNRGTFKEQVNASIANSQKDATHALVLIDLDNLKMINDLNGHAAGDRALVAVADTLRSVFRQADLIGRIGGDEFCVFLHNVTGSAPVSRRIRHMNASLTAWTGNEFSATCSAGVSMYPEDGRTFDELFDKADRALYRAKRSGALDVTKPDHGHEEIEVKHEPDRCYVFQNEEEWRYRGILESTQTIVIEYDFENDRYSYDINASKYLTGMYDERPLWQILSQDGVTDAETINLIQRIIRNVSMSEEQGSMSTDVRLKNDQGRECWFRMRIVKLSGKEVGAGKVLIVLNDVHEEVLAVEQLRKLALYDDLTGLHSKDAFIYNVASRVRLAEPGTYALIAMDVDRFRIVNELFGFEAGDRLLCHIGNILATATEDEGDAARLNADQFLVLLPYDADAIHHAFIPDTIRKIKELEPNMDVVANFGIYVVQDIDEDVIVMIDRAQAAKNVVKGGYTDRYALYDDRLRHREQKEKEVVSRMHRALANDEFRVFFQPWYHHVTGELVGAEALTRWEHPTRGLLLPREFIPLFEENGFISELDRYVWRQVCAMQRSWSEQGKLTVPISVNISKVDLFDPKFKERLLKVIREESVCPAMLGIEVTESTFSDDFEHVNDVLRTVSNEGLSLYLDDFGTGYSSLNMLKDVPVDVLKLDMRFLSTTQKNSEKARSIVRSILEMCNDIGVKTVAEGVESVEQADELVTMGCHIVQGFLYSPALPVTEFEKLLRRADDPDKGSSA